MQFRARPTPRDIRHVLFEALGIGGSPPTRPIEFDTLLKDALAERFRVLVCDEAQWLSRECFELWRHLWDDRRTQIAIVFVGGGDCYRVLRADRLSAAGWDWLLAVCRRTGTRLLLICHVQAVPPALADVLEGTTHEIVTDLRRALPRRQGRAPAIVHSVLAPTPEAVDLPLYANEQINTYRSAAPAAIGLWGFLQTDAVYQQERAAAGAWLDTHLTGAGKILDIAQVQLFLTEPVQDSPTRNHSLARLRGAQAGFRARSFDLKLPAWQLMVTGQLTGPGLDHGAAGLSVPVLFLHSLPWEALSPDNDTLRLTWFPQHATLVPSTFTIRRHHPITAVFPVPPAATGGPRLRRRVRQHHGAAVRLDDFHV